MTPNPTNDPRPRTLLRVKIEDLLGAEHMLRGEYDDMTLIPGNGIVFTRSDPKSLGEKPAEMYVLPWHAMTGCSIERISREQFDADIAAAERAERDASRPECFGRWHECRREINTQDAEAFPCDRGMECQAASRRLSFIRTDQGRSP